MLKILKAKLRQTSIFQFWNERRQKQAFARWVSEGKPEDQPAPPLAKQQTVREFAAKYRTPVFVETGTLAGDMVAAVRPSFKRLYSIELSRPFYEQCAARFAGDSAITIVHGDSGEMIPRLLADISQPCLFWLDGHYSGGATARGQVDTPIRAELSAIAAHPLINGHVILIDDARCFGKGDYPSIDDLKSWAADVGKSCVVRHDMIRIYPPDPNLEP